MCSIRLLQCVSVDFFSSPDGSRFLEWNKNSTDVSFGVFIINAKGILFFILFVLFQAMRSGSVLFTWLNHFAL